MLTFWLAAEGEEVFNLPVQHRAGTQAPASPLVRRRFVRCMRVSWVFLRSSCATLRAFSRPLLYECNKEAQYCRILLPLPPFVSLPHAPTHATTPPFRRRPPLRTRPSMSIGLARKPRSHSKIQTCQQHRKANALPPSPFCLSLDPRTHQCPPTLQPPPYPTTSLPPSFYTRRPQHSIL